MNLGRQLESRHSSRLVGGFLIIAFALLVFGLSQSGVVDRWLNPMQKIRVLLPQEGLFGLSAGSNVEILGTKGGYVESIVIEPDKQIYAEVLIRRDALPFIRTDSNVVIRKQFGVAGDSYLDISRGFGQELDWEFAVLQAKADRAPTDLLQATIEEIREQVVPTMKEARRAVTAFADIAEQLNDPQGDLAKTLAATERISTSISNSEGLVGRLISDPEFADRFEQMIARLDKDLARIEPLMNSLNKTADNVESITGALDDQSDTLPQITERLNASLASLNEVLADVKRASPRLPEATDNLADASTSLPSLVVQTRTTLSELEALTKQIRSSWLLGGGKEAEPEDGLTPEEATP